MVGIHPTYVINVMIMMGYQGNLQFMWDWGAQTTWPNFGVFHKGKENL